MNKLREFADKKLTSSFTVPLPFDVIETRTPKTALKVSGLKFIVVMLPALKESTFQGKPVQTFDEVDD